MEAADLQHLPAAAGCRDVYEASLRKPKILFKVQGYSLLEWLMLSPLAEQLTEPFILVSTLG